MTECPSCHTTAPRPHTEYCRGNPLDLALGAAAKAILGVERSWGSAAMWDAAMRDARVALEAALPVLLDAVTVQAREHVAAGRGHMTWAETLTQLRRMTQTTIEESP